MARIFSVFFWIFVYFQNRFAKNQSAGKNLRKLVAFDFDHTVVDSNTDLVVRDLIDNAKISDEVNKLYKSSGWISYMQEIFHILHANGLKKADIKSAIENIEEVAGLKSLIQRLHGSGCVDVIVISDSNSTFIKYWCDYHGITDCIKRVYTNYAEFNNDDVLKIQPYHHQKSCRLSSENLCKGDILEEFVRNEQETNNVFYEIVFYVGDGQNDICPVLRLGCQDFGFARRGYRMHKEIDNVLNAEHKPLMDAKLLVWNDGHDLTNHIFQHIWSLPNSLLSI